MAWKAYEVVLLLRSPLHIGAGKVGNLQRTRPYITGRNLWGALTARLTRSAHESGQPAPQTYETIGERVHAELAFTYFYPTTKEQAYVPFFPIYDAQGRLRYGLNGKGMDAATFRYRFLSTYASTALNYTTVSAEEASLHEVECLLPNTRAVTTDDQSDRVYLTGYIFQQDGSDLNWESALSQLQIGGERGYGWGQVEICKKVAIQKNEVNLFDVGHTAHLDGDNVNIRLKEGEAILAHTLATDHEQREDHKVPTVPQGVIEGRVEPLVGRYTKPDSLFGVNLSQARICYVPGDRVKDSICVQIGRFGIWEIA